MMHFCPNCDTFLVRDNQLGNVYQCPNCNKVIKLSEETLNHREPHIMMDEMFQQHVDGD